MKIKAMPMKIFSHSFWCYIANCINCNGKVDSIYENCRCKCHVKKIIVMKNITKMSGLVAMIFIVTTFAGHLAEATDTPADKTGCAFYFMTKETCVYLFNINQKEQTQIDLLNQIIVNQQTEIRELCEMVKAQGGKTC